VAAFIFGEIMEQARIADEEIPDMNLDDVADIFDGEGIAALSEIQSHQTIERVNHGLLWNK
jgi:hypothetical protein